MVRRRAGVDAASPRETQPVCAPLSAKCTSCAADREAGHRPRRALDQGRRQAQARHRPRDSACAASAIALTSLEVGGERRASSSFRQPASSRHSDPLFARPLAASAGERKRAALMPRRPAPKAAANSFHRAESPCLLPSAACRNRRSARSSWRCSCSLILAVFALGDLANVGSGNIGLGWAARRWPRSATRRSPTAT